MKYVILLLLVAASVVAAVLLLRPTAVLEARAYHAVSGRDFDILPDGGAIIAGHIRLEHAQEDREYGYWLLRVDGSGHKLWERQIGAEFWPDRYRVAALRDGGFALVGAKTPAGADAADAHAWLLRTDGDGNTLWEKTFPNLSSYGLFVVPGADGGVVVVGNPLGENETDILVLGIDFDGTVVRETKIVGAGALTAEAVTVDPAGGYLFAGRESLDGPKSKIWATSLDGEGIVRWRMDYPASGRDDVRAITSLPDGGFALLVQMNPELYRIVRVAGSRNTLWNRTYSTTSRQRFKSLMALPDGDLIVLSGGDKIGAPARGIQVQRLDRVGDIVWEHEFGTRNLERARAIRPLPGGGFAVVGETNCEATGIIWFLRYPPQLTSLPATRQSGGLGVARPCIEWAWKDTPGSRSIFGKVEHIDGQATVAAESADKRWRFELVGPLTNLVRATATMPMEPQDPDAHSFASYFVLMAAPDAYPDHADWLKSMLARAEQETTVRHELDGREVILRYDPELGTTSVSVRAAP